MNEISTLEKKVSKQYYCIQIIIFQKICYNNNDRIYLSSFVIIWDELHGSIVVEGYGSVSTSYKPPTYLHVLKQEQVNKNERWCGGNYKLKFSVFIVCGLISRYAEQVLQQKYVHLG